MNAVYITQHGGVGALTYGDLPEPAIGPNDVNIRVRACAINRLDLYTRAGVRGSRLSLDGPHILGGDVAGDVAEVGSEVTRVKPGDRVVVNPRLALTDALRFSDTASGLPGSSFRRWPGLIATCHSTSKPRFPGLLSTP